MEDREPTIRSRELGEGLRRAMEKAELNGKQMAERMDCSRSWVSRLLSGKRGGSEKDVIAFLAICGVRGKERTRLLELAREQNMPGWLQQHGSRLPKQLVTLIDHENRAESISEFEFNLIPGLLQTGDYARSAISKIVNVPPSEVDDRVAARLARQNLFSRSRPPRFTFYLHEFALRLPVGGSDVMSDQLHHLLRMSVRTCLTLRVVPAVLGAHAAMAGSFRLMDIPNFKAVVYLEGETSCLFLEEHEEVVAYRRIISALEESALDEGQSKALIATVATELYSDRGDHDEHA